MTNEIRIGDYLSNFGQLSFTQGNTMSPQEEMAMRQIIGWLQQTVRSGNYEAYATTHLPRDNHYVLIKNRSGHSFKSFKCLFQLTRNGRPTEVVTAKVTDWRAGEYGKLSFYAPKGSFNGLLMDIRSVQYIRMEQPVYGQSKPRTSGTSTGQSTAQKASSAYNTPDPSWQTYNQDRSKGQGTYQSGTSTISWGLVIFMLVIFWPLGLVLMWKKLVDDSRARTPGGYENPMEQWLQQQTDKAKQTVKDATTTPASEIPKETKESYVKKEQEHPYYNEADPMTYRPLKEGKGSANYKGDAVSVLLTAICVVAALYATYNAWLSGFDWFNYHRSNDFSLLVQWGALAVGFIILTIVIMRRMVNRRDKFNRYLAIINATEPTADIDTICELYPTTYDKAVKDLQVMINKGFYKGAFIDFAGRQLVFPENGGKAMTEEEIKNKEARKYRKTGKTSDNKELTPREEYLATIRNCKAAVDDKGMKDKFTKLEDVIGKIYDRLEEVPNEKYETQKFMNRYLPLMINAIETYSDLAQKHIPGSQVAELKEQIDQSLDSFIAAYERLLGKLYMNEVVDVSTDLSALETALAKDGLLDKQSIMSEVAEPIATADETDAATGASTGKTVTDIPDLSMANVDVDMANLDSAREGAETAESDAKKAAEAEAKKAAEEEAVKKAAEEAAAEEVKKAQEAAKAAEEAAKAAADEVEGATDGEDKPKIELTL